MAAVVVAGSGVAVAPGAATARGGAPTAAAGDSVPGGYHAVPAARLLDTRNGTGAPAGLRAAGSTTSLGVLGAHGVPATGVSAVLVTVVATGTTGTGYLTTFPHGSAAPQASTLNWTAGRTVSNTALVRVGAGGAVDLRVSGTATHLVADVVGWVEDAAGSPGPGGITPLTPSRVLDTRSGVGAPARPVPGGSVLGLAVAGRGGVPATGAGAVVLNVTVAGASAGGHVTVSPTDPGPGGTSSLNYATGETVANLVTVGLGPDGGVDLRVTSPGTVRLVADVVGWVAQGAPAGPLGVTPVTPTRLLDTREPAGGGAVLGGSRRTVQVTGRGGVPTTGAGAGLLNVTVSDATYTGHLTVVASGAGVPASSTLNFEKGRTKASFAVGLLPSSGRVDVVASSGGTLRLVVDVVGWVEGPPADVAAPTVPTPVSATVSGTSVTVGWTPPADEDPLTYRVDRIVNEGPPWQKVVRSTVGTTSGTSVVDTGAPPGLALRYEVVAVDPWHNAGPAGSSPSRTVPLTVGTPEVVAPVTGGLLDVDCPTATWCVALERDGAVRTWNGTAWSGRTQLLPRRADGDPFAGLAHVSCADPTFCVATRNDDPSVMVWRAGSWTRVDLGDRGASAVSCPTTTRCRLLGAPMTAFGTPDTVLEFDGERVLGRTTLPTGVEWRALSCGSTTSCAVTGITPSVPYTSYAAVLNGSTWTRTRLGTGPEEVHDVSCPAAASCVAVSDGHAFWVLGSGGWSARTSSVLGSSWHGAVLDCTSSRWCLSSDWNGSSARFDGSTWRAVTGGVDPPRGRALAMSCASTTACVRVYPEGTVRWFRGSTWSSTTAVAPAAGPVVTLSCSSATACVGLDADGSVRAWNGSTWGTPRPLAVNLVECPSDDWCLAGGTDAVSESRYLVRTGDTWSAAAPSPIQLAALSCPVKGWCMARDAYGTTSVFSGARWSTPVRHTGAAAEAGMLACSGPRFCVLVADRTQRTWDGTRWSAATATTMVRPYNLDCTADDWCLVLEQSGRYWQRTRTSSWTGATSGVGTQSDLSCTSRAFCLAVGGFTGGMGYSVWGGVMQDVRSTTDVPGQPGVWGATTSCWAPGQCFVAEGPRIIRVSAG
ncbi:fibronectin type III domain-containing protein [Phycicoccus sonneratiae]|uniref:fibronectin type III domain-containing protein n=1 Tax=Phycicoccus sonneratiae TaxID=2807628 RepID=UPI001EF39DC8|nr:fibronectin type III domain-containing protein [Phycicoccus sonneraticus]